MLDELGGGEPSLSLRRHCLRREGRPFTRGSSAHARTSPLPQPSSAQPTVDLGASLRKRRSEERWTSALHSWTGLRPLRERCRRCVVARCPLHPRKRWSYRTPGAPTKRARKARANAKAQAETPDAGARARIGRSGSRSRVVNRRSRNRQLVVWRREAGGSHFTRFGPVRGRAPSVRPNV